MKKTLKIFAIIFMAIAMVCTCTQASFAAINTEQLIDDVNSKIDGDTAAASELVQLAGKVIGLIQIASAVAAIILVAVFGFKFILGSANEKADYQKSFIPLIVGVVVVFAATSIAKLLFGLIG
jgi:type IV secretory pathway VirB2 component (pilin)